MSAAVDGAQLAIAVPAPPPTPLPWRPVGDTSVVAVWLGPCRECGDGPLAEQHRPVPRDGARRFFDALDALDRDRAALARQVLTRGRDDLARLARSDAHAGDESFAAGVAWGHALAGLAVAALDGEDRPDRLSFVALQRRATRGRGSRR